ncbi:hypothetical protein [Trueperella pecoris]|uniref:hypothetical protein n=1 Tax=Trueperella pecoris TaxID=2733571 RepID=UPI001ABE4BAB|nr:hypothetical protein [Trueperella pecoris]QTG74707.1 hypothetical protein J4179_05550 [Trueperella pecoris]
MPLWQYMVRYHAADLFHPNSPWYAVWAQEFADVVAAAYGWRSVNVDDIGPWPGPISTDL